MTAGKLAAAVVAVGVATTGCQAARDKEPPIAAQSGPHPAGTVRGIVTVANGGFENAPRSGMPCPERWECSMHADPSSFAFQLAGFGLAAEGRQALCIYRVKPEPWALVTQLVLAHPMRGARARVTVAVRIDPDTAAGISAGPWVLVRGPLGNLAFQERPVTSTNGWERITAEVPIAANAETLEFGATVLGGGRACFDDVRLEILP